MVPLILALVVALIVQKDGAFFIAVAAFLVIDATAGRLWANKVGMAPSQGMIRGGSWVLWRWLRDRDRRLEAEHGNG